MLDLYTIIHCCLLKDCYTALLQLQMCCCNSVIDDHRLQKISFARGMSFSSIRVGVQRMARMKTEQMDCQLEFCYTAYSCRLWLH